MAVCHLFHFPLNGVLRGNALAAVTLTNGSFVRVEDTHSQSGLPVPGGGCSPARTRAALTCSNSVKQRQHPDGLPLLGWDRWVNLRRVLGSEHSRPGERPGVFPGSARPPTVSEIHRLSDPSQPARGSGTPVHRPAPRPTEAPWLQPGPPSSSGRRERVQRVLGQARPALTNSWSWLLAKNICSREGQSSRRRSSP